MLKCLENTVKFFNKHAFSEIILSGKSFCPSTLHAMKVISSNASRFGILHGLGEIVMLFSVILLTSATTASCYYILKYQGVDTTLGTPIFAILIVSSNYLS